MHSHKKRDRVDETSPVIGDSNVAAAPNKRRRRTKKQMQKFKTTDNSGNFESLQQLPTLIKYRELSSKERDAANRKVKSVYKQATELFEQFGVPSLFVLPPAVASSSKDRYLVAPVGTRRHLNMSNSCRTSLRKYETS